MALRSRPLMIAPVIPLLGIVGIFGIEQLHATRYLPFFIIVWSVLLAALFVYVLQKALQARRTRTNR